MTEQEPPSCAAAIFWVVVMIALAIWVSGWLIPEFRDEHPPCTRGPAITWHGQRMAPCLIPVKR